MRSTGENYTQALAAVTSETVERVTELRQAYRDGEGDHIDREHLLVQARNLLATLPGDVVEPAAFRRLHGQWPQDRQLDVLDEFLSRSDLSVEDEAWAKRRRFNLMSMPPYGVNTGEGAWVAWGDPDRPRKLVEEFLAYDAWAREHLDPDQWAAILANQTLLGAFKDLGRLDEAEDLWCRRLDEVPATAANRVARLNAVRDLLWGAHARGDRDAEAAYAARMRSIIDETPDWDGAVVWENTLRQTAMLNAPWHTEQTRIAAVEKYAQWIRSLQPPQPVWLGELTALCMFGGLYAIGDRYGAEAIEAGAAAENAHDYVWYAGCHLGATNDVAGTVAILRAARRHISESELVRLIKTQAPFHDHPNADDFLAAIKTRAA